MCNTLSIPPIPRPANSTMENREGKLLVLLLLLLLSWLPSAFEQAGLLMVTSERWIFISKQGTGSNASFCLVLVRSSTEWSPCPSQASIAGSLGAVFWILKCSRAEKQNTTKQELGLESTWRSILKHKYIKTRACPALPCMAARGWAPWAVAEVGTPHRSLCTQKQTWFLPQSLGLL